MYCKLFTSATIALLLSVSTTSGAAPTSSKPTDGNPGMTLGNIETSMVPGVACPLVDNQPNKDLVAAADNLSKNIASFKTACSGTMSSLLGANTSEVDNMQSYLSAIIAAGKNLKGFADSPETFANDPSKLSDVQSNVSNLIKGINGIGTALSNNSLLSKSCAQNMMKSTDVIMGMSDLVQAASPIVMNVLSAVPAFEPAIPFVLGISAAGNVAKVIGQLKAENSLNMDDPKVRQAILQNICEYTRIVQRVNSIRAARLGNLKDATSHLAQIENFNQRITMGLPPDMVQTLQMGTRLKSDLKQVSHHCSEDQVIVDDLKENMSASSDPAYVCSATQGALSAVGDASQPILHSIPNLKKVLSNPLVTDMAERISISGMLSAEASLRHQISTFPADGNINTCAQNSQAYLQTLIRIVSTSKNYAKRSEQQINDKVRSLGNAKVQSLIDTQASVDAESTRRQTLISSTGSMNDIEIDRDLRAIKLALFGSRPGFLWSGDSPVISWYKDVDHYVRYFQTDFSNEVRKLREEARYDYVQQSPLGFDLGDVSEGPNGFLTLNWGLGPLHDAQALGPKISSVNNLNPLNLHLLPEGSASHLAMCKRLQGVLGDWQSVLDNLSSLNLYCGYLDDYMDQSFDPNIVKACKGDTDWSNKSMMKSDLTVLREQLAANSQADAQLILKRFSDLKCLQYLN